MRVNLLWVYDGAVPFDGRGLFNAQPDDWKDSLSLIMANEYSAAWLLLEGEAEIRHGNDTLTAKAGQWVVPKPGLREQCFSDDARVLSIRFQSHWPDKRALFDDGLGVVFAREQGLQMEASARKLLSIVAPHQSAADWRLLGDMNFSFPAFIDVKIEMLRFVRSMYEVLLGLGLKPTRLGMRDERILAALSYLDRLPLHHKLRESEVATEVTLGLSQFVRLFRSQVGVTPRKYFEERRCDAARRMLLHSSLPIKQLAGEFGFAHHTDFTAWFRRIHGVSPRTFRERYPLEATGRILRTTAGD